MNFIDFFKQNTDRRLAERIKAATELKMDSASREHIRMLLSEYTQMRPFRTQTSASTSRSTFGSFLATHIHPMPFIAAVLIVVVSGGTVAAAEGTLPGDILYPVKVHFTEETRAVLTTTPKARADWAVARAERRLEEAAMLALEGRLDDAVRAEIDTNLDEHMKSAGESRQQLEDGKSDASEVERNIGAVRIARANILNREKRTARVATVARTERAGDATAMTMQMAAPVETEQQEQVATEEPETVWRGQRTAAKVRIGAATKFLDRSNRIGTTTQEKARQRLQAATEAFSTGDDDAARGNNEEASTSFNSALEVATEIETLISEPDSSSNNSGEQPSQEENDESEKGEGENGKRGSSGSSD